jgi:hypothetical protein
MDDMLNDIQNGAWEKIDNTYDLLFEAIENWKDHFREYIEYNYGYDMSEADSLGCSGILDDLTKEIDDAIAAREHKYLKDNFDELFDVCDELKLDITEYYDDIQDSITALKIHHPNIIYNNKESNLYIPELILCVNDQIINLLKKEPDYLFKLHPRKFEEIIADIFYKNGYEVELTKCTRDGGRDIIAISRNLNIFTKYIIECKRYAPLRKISIGVVQRLLGVKIAERANKAILATTSSYTKDARIFANNHIWDLDLKDYNDILCWINSY